MGSIDSSASMPFPATSTPDPVPCELLPPATSPHLKLVPATILERTQCWHINSHSWRGPLTLDQYLLREDRLQQQALTKDGQITYWILTSPNLPIGPDGARPILASCETLLKGAYVARDGKIEKMLSHGIGSVYTRGEYRGMGYAGRMMTELGKNLETWQQKNDQKGYFSVLYSDIGTKFYSQRGWKVFPSTHIQLSPLSQPEYDKAAKSLPQVTDVFKKDLSKFDAIGPLEDELIAASLSRPSVPHVAFRPDLEHFAWHHAREEFQCETLSSPGGFPAVKGAIHPATGIAVAWTRMFSSNTVENELHILRTIIPTNAAKATDPTQVEEVMAALLLRAQREAQVWGMHAGVKVWSPDPMTLKAAQRLRDEEDGKIEVLSRDKESICSLKWIAGPADEEVVWLANQKYAWC